MASKKPPVSRVDPTATPLTEERARQLLDLFPEAGSDGKIDFDRLKSALGEDVDSIPDRFGFSWAGKQDATRLLRVPSRGRLAPDSDHSRDIDSTNHAFITGDNLEVQKLLYRSYFGQIKLVYIDPPYNTGKDMIYHDNFQDPLGAYLAATGQVDENGNLLTSNPDTSGRFHSAWLNMMYPRLIFASQLLREDGVLMVSCNDIEQANLKLVLNEVLGEENFAATLVWNNEGNIDNQSKIKANHEFVHVYARDLDKFERPSVIDPNITEDSKLYNDEIENSITKNGKANPASEVTLPVGFPAAFDEGEIEPRLDKRPLIKDKVVVKGGVLTAAVRVESGWSSANLLKLFIDNESVPIQDGEGKETRFALTDSGAIYSYKKRSDQQGHVLTVIRNVGTTKKTGSRLSKWGLDFSYPKPVGLLEYLVRIVTKDDELVMDLFAGSATTGEAVLKANREDGGRRTYILVQYPEETEEGSKPREAGYRSIAEMGLERMRRASEELSQTPGAPDGEDLGVRAYELAESSFRQWAGVEEADGEAYEKEMALFSDPLMSGWTRDGLLAELALREGFGLDAKYAHVEDVGTNDVYRVTSRRRKDAILVCLDAKLEPETAEALDLSDEDVFICRDVALDDSLAANLAAQCQLKVV